MHFDVEGGEVIVLVNRLDDGSSLVLHAPPEILEIRKKDSTVNPDGNTQVNVVRSEVVYMDSENRPRRVTKGKQVDLLKRSPHGSRARVEH